MFDPQSEQYNNTAFGGGAQFQEFQKPPRRENNTFDHKPNKYSKQMYNQEQQEPQTQAASGASGFEARTILDEMMRMRKQQERVVENLNLFQAYVTNEIQGLKSKLNQIEQSTQNLGYLLMNKGRGHNEEF